MADPYKCTKLEMGTTPAVSSGDVGFRVTYYEAGIPNPTLLSSIGEMDKVDAEDPTLVQTAVSAQVTADRGGGIDWTL